jgi:hypothetical protein
VGSSVCGTRNSSQLEAYWQPHVEGRLNAVGAIFTQVDGIYALGEEHRRLRMVVFAMSTIQTNQRAVAGCYPSELERDAAHAAAGEWRNARSDAPRCASWDPCRHFPPPKIRHPSFSGRWTSADYCVDSPWRELADFPTSTFPSSKTKSSWLPLKPVHTVRDQPPIPNRRH